MPSLPAVEWPILDLSQSPGQRVWSMTYLCPVRHTFCPSSLLLKYNSFEHGYVVDRCPSRGKCAVSRDLCSLVTGEKKCSRRQHPDWISSTLAETGEAASPSALDSSSRQKCGQYGLGWPVSCSAVDCALRVARSRKKRRNSDSGYFTRESTSLAQTY